MKTLAKSLIVCLCGLPLLLTWADWASFPLWVLVLSGLGVLYVNVAYLFVFPLMMYPKPSGAADSKRFAH